MGQFGEVCALAAEQIAHGLVAFFKQVNSFRHRFRYPLFVFAVKKANNEGGGTSLFNSDILYPIAQGKVNAPRRFLRAGRLPGRGGLVYGETVVTQEKPLTNRKIAVEARETQGEDGGIGAGQPQSVGANLEIRGEVVHAIIHKADSGGKPLGGVVMQFSEIAAAAGVLTFFVVLRWGFGGESRLCHSKRRGIPVKPTDLHIILKNDMISTTICAGDSYGILDA